MERRMRDVRISKGITLEVLARKTGVSTSQLNNYERGFQIPPINIAEKIASALGDYRLVDIFPDIVCQMRDLAQRWMTN